MPGGPGRGPGGPGRGPGGPGGPGMPPPRGGYHGGMNRGYGRGFGGPGTPPPRGGSLWRHLHIRRSAILAELFFSNRKCEISYC